MKDVNSMIAYLQGTVHFVAESHVVLLVQGVGYAIDVPMKTLSSLLQGQALALAIHDVFREDAHDLYGFVSQDERDVFRLILKAPQVGPKLALAILDVFSASDLARIAEQDAKDELLRVKGLGPKLANRLIVDLKSWVDKGLLHRKQVDAGEESLAASHTEALQALLHLGYKAHHIKKVLADQAPDASTSVLVRYALQILSHRGGV